MIRRTVNYDELDTFLYGQKPPTEEIKPLKEDLAPSEKRLRYDLGFSIAEPSSATREDIMAHLPDVIASFAVHKSAATPPADFQMMRYVLLGILSDAVGEKAKFQVRQNDTEDVFAVALYDAPNLNERQRNRLVWNIAGRLQNVKPENMRDEKSADYREAAKLFAVLKPDLFPLQSEDSPAPQE